MTAFLSQTELSKGGLKLFLSNDLGQMQDAASVKWTIYTPSGVPVSGRNLCAIKKAVGEYYAPWFTDVSGGSYRIEWEIREDSCSLPRIISENFFIADPAMYAACGLSDSIEIGPGTYVAGSQVGPDDLFLMLKDSSGFLQDAYSVFWTVFNSAGRVAAQRTQAAHAGTGHYYASWIIPYTVGDFTIKWEYQQDQDSPLQSISQNFYILSSEPYFSIITLSPCGTYANACSGNIAHTYIIPCNTYSLCPDIGFFCSPKIDGCAPCVPSVPVSPPMPNPQESCCAFELPRTIHLPWGTLPSASAFTSQSQYAFPTGVRHVTFYITYSRGTTGGFAVFKLFWGNGTDEVQETVIDTELQDNATLSIQQSMFLQELEGPIPANSSPINYIVYVRVPGGSNRVRLLAAERGVPAVPGMLSISVTAST